MDLIITKNYIEELADKYANKNNSAYIDKRSLIYTAFAQGYAQCLEKCKGKTVTESGSNCILSDVVVVINDYPTPNEIDEMNDEYRNNHYCPNCLAMFEMECVCDTEEYD